MDVIVMDIPNIKGESQLKNFTDKIELLSFSHGVAMQITGDVSNAERTSGRPNHQDFTATKYLDKASPLLNQACCKGTVLGTVKITVGRNDKGAVLPIILYELENSVLSSVSVGGGSGDKPVETLTLNYSKITWTFNAQKEAGGKEGEVKAAWDVSTNDAGS
jgi:type VI secretion system secreted protein Hcp